MLIKKFALVLLFCVFSVCIADATQTYPIALDAYPKASGLWTTLVERAKLAPMNLYATIIFACAIVHTFSYQIFKKFASSLKRTKNSYWRESDYDIAKRILSLLGEVEIIFALWLIPLFAVFTYKYGWNQLTDYLNDLAYNQDKYSEPVFVMVVMCISATRPIIHLASKFISVFARLGGGTVKAWWISIMCVGPLLGSFITEPAAITICALLLVQHFFAYSPSEKFKYATLALLFVSVSIGGALSHFAAPPIIMVARTWDWDISYMMSHFGWKSVLLIFVSTLAYARIFKNEFQSLENKSKKSEKNKRERKRPPNWVVVAHLLFLIASVATMHYLVFEVFLLLAFIAFVDVTRRFQNAMSFRGPMLVAIFLGALVTHGSLQAWWLEPLLSSLNAGALFSGCVLLTAFNDNAAITYLASLVPSFSDDMKYLIVAAAISGGGLTVMANAPNLVGLSVLKKEFIDGVSPKLLLKWATLPTLLASLLFYFS